MGLSVIWPVMEFHRGATSAVKAQARRNARYRMAMQAQQPQPPPRRPEDTLMFALGRAVRLLIRLGTKLSKALR